MSLDIRTRKKGRSYPSLSLILTKPKWEFFFSRLCLPNDKQGKKGSSMRCWSLYLTCATRTAIQQLEQPCFQNAKSSPPFSFTQEWRKIGMLQTRRLDHISTRSCSCVLQAHEPQLRIIPQPHCLMQRNNAYI